MKLNKKNILHLADLAKLQLSDEEISTYGTQLEGILSYVDNINKLDLDKVKESLSGAEEIKLAPRPDSAAKSDAKANNQANKMEGDYVVAPNVFDSSKITE